MSKFNLFPTESQARATKEEADKIIYIQAGEDSGKYAVVSESFDTNRSYYHSSEGQKIYFTLITNTL